ncbi:MAG: LLM class flavin-dependent oxidoreductase [Actinomycetes bacterium]
MATQRIQLGYGLITCQRHPDNDNGWAPLYAEALDLASAAEAAGLDSVWVSEHHFVDDGHAPSLLVLLAAMAARTSTIRLGTALLLAPFYDPLRLIEDAATVDQISGGRLTLGLGLGWRDEEFEAFGVKQSERVRRLVEMIAYARQAWSGSPVELLDGRARPVVTPGPNQEAGPPLWIGALVEPAVRRAGKIADGFMATDASPADLAEQIGWAREEHARAGRTTPFSVALHLPTLCHRDGVSWDDAVDHVRYPDWKYEDMYDARSYAGPLRRPPEHDESASARMRETSIVGSPREVADRIREYADAAGGDLHMIARSYFPSMTPELRSQSLEALGDVARLLRE